MKSQSNEDEIIEKYMNMFQLTKRFVEFGFSPVEFNCNRLVGSFEGLLIDGDENNVLGARSLFGENITVLKEFLTLENLNVIFDWIDGRPVGVLSIDVDGNDFWFADKLSAVRAEMMIIEYNASLLQHNITVPYDAKFDRMKNYPTGIFYHGASFNAIRILMYIRGYTLVDISESGVNLFFIANEFLRDKEMAFDVISKPILFRENVIRNNHWKMDAYQQWLTINTYPYVDIGPLLPRS